MRYTVNGRPDEYGSEADRSVGSDAIRKAAGIPADRPLVLQLPDGRTWETTPGEDLSQQPEQFFVDTPRRCWGPNLPGETAPVAGVRSDALPVCSEGTKSPTSSNQEE